MVRGGESPLSSCGLSDPESERSELRLVCAGMSSFSGIRGDRSCSLLDVSFNDLSDFEGLSDFTNIETLTVDNNNIKSLETLPSLPSLKTLWLNKNCISDVDSALEVLSTKMPNIEYLSLIGNPGCKSEMNGSTPSEAERYRLYCIYKLPKLVFLDSSPVKEDERQNAIARGQYLKVAKPTVAAVGATAEVQPNKLLEAQTKKSQPTFGKQRRFYTGKFSEGNRFIRDDVL
eukprot:TRINITY_DN20886_c0_g1_i1.p1 TRINITY_DN20886_c0_g1~~TRINITY_DN20886_c0_g1_i1.p1  ORF type:complete len:250 (+),score=65.56 TRINITY_DN20886_c0_g1_i1:60-752(+)